MVVHITWCCLLHFGLTGAEILQRLRDKQQTVQDLQKMRITPAAIMCTPDCHRIVALGSALTTIEKEFKEILLRYVSGVCMYLAVQGKREQVVASIRHRDFVADF